MKRIICIVLLSVMFLSISLISFAQETPEISAETFWSYENNENILNVKITGNLGKAYADEKILIKVMKENIEDSASVKPIDKYSYIYSIYTNSDGEFENSFRYSGDSGIYKFNVISDTMDNSVETYKFIASSTIMEELLNKLKEHKFDKATLSEFLLLNNENIGMWNDEYKNLSSEITQNISQYIIDNIKEYTAKSFEEIYSEALLVKGIYKNESIDSSKNIFERLENLTDIKSNALYSQFEELNPSETEDFYKCFSNSSYESLEDLKNGFYQNLAMIKIKQSERYTDISYTVQKFEKELSSLEEIKKYIDLSDNNKQKANLILIDNIKSFDSINTMTTAFEYAINKIKENTGGGGSSSDRPSRRPVGSGGVVMQPSTEPVLVDKIDNTVFEDVKKGFWGYDSIMKLYEKNIVSGKTNKTFCPDDNITRAEFAKLIVSSLGIEMKSIENNFKDITEKDWYYSYILTAADSKIIFGFENGEFKPNENIKREDAAVMVYRAINASKDEEIAAETFKDDAIISDYAKKAVYSLREKNIINGYNNEFSPDGLLSRAEAAQIISNMLSKI